MNLWLLAALSAALMLWLWLVQTAVLWWVGERPVVRFPMRHRCQSPVVRWALKVTLQGVLFALLFLYPALIGENPLTYHADRLRGQYWGQLFRLSLVAVAGFGGLFLIYWAGGLVTFAVKYDRWVTLRKVARGFLTPIPLAFVEEAIFRGEILDQLLRAGPAHPAYRATMIVLAGGIFAGVHFLRPQKHTALPLLSLWALGALLGVAYLTGGSTYWMSVGLHAGGIWFIQVSRPFAQYRGPAWLIGYASYPMSGALGLALMAGVALWLVSGAPGV